MASDEYGVSGHGYEIAVEADPVGNPDVYTVVGGLSSDIVDKYTREYTATMSHNVGVDGGVVSNIITRPDATYENNYVPGGVNSAVHDGIIREHFRLNREFKIRKRGPGGSTGNDEIIETGKVIDYEKRSPIGGGARVLAWVFRPIGPFTVDGVDYD
jgi:hypothetical protein